MADKKIVEMLVEEMANSKRFTESNFGLKVGSAFPEIARELLAEDHVVSSLMENYLLLMVDGPKASEFKNKSLPEMVRTQPRVYDQAISFFYWGMQIGRRLQQQEDAALGEIAQARRDS